MHLQRRNSPPFCIALYSSIYIARAIERGSAGYAASVLWEGPGRTCDVNKVGVNVHVKKVIWR